jgi:hypothetical protein
VEIASQVIIALQKLRCYNGVMNINAIQSLPDEKLLRDVETAAARERNAITELIALLGETDVCRLYLQQGRCDERGFLEFHHVIPFADGGQTTLENLQLRCRAHNDYEARRHFDFALM